MEARREVVPGRVQRRIARRRVSLLRSNLHRVLSAARAMFSAPNVRAQEGAGRVLERVVNELERQRAAGG
jgi:hypothetical protein